MRLPLNRQRSPRHWRPPILLRRSATPWAFRQPNARCPAMFRSTMPLLPCANAPWNDSSKRKRGCPDRGAEVKPLTEAGSASHELVVGRRQVRRQNRHVTCALGITDRRQDVFQLVVLLRVGGEVAPDVGLRLGARLTVCSHHDLVGPRVVGQVLLRRTRDRPNGGGDAG